MNPHLYIVGGTVRDAFAGVSSGDEDYSVEIESFDAMRQWLTDLGFTIYVEDVETVTIRAKVPKGHPLSLRTDVADFVACRKDSDTSDGRRPDSVEIGDIWDDLARRDFTVNAMAIPVNLDTWTWDAFNLLDPHGGLEDLAKKTLRFVGDPMTRIREDGVRVLRAFRFSITKGFIYDMATWDAVVTEEAAEMLYKVHVNRIYDEMCKMFNYGDTLAIMELLSTLPSYTLDTMFREGLHLRMQPSLKKVKG